MSDPGGPRPQPETSLLVGVKRPLRKPLRRFRLATRGSRILPSFLIIGAQRAGTTSLFRHLARHPDIAEPRGLDGSVAWTKELHFFDEKFDRGVDWYRSFFPLELWRRAARAVGRDLLAVEATPYYLFDPLVPERVAATLPDVRLVALLRDPVERAYSHYQMMVRAGRERLSFEDALAMEDERLAGERHQLVAAGGSPAARHRNKRYIARGLYAEQLERWFQHLPREQLLVLLAEDYRDRPGTVYADVLEFLGVRPWKPNDLAPRNTGSYAPIPQELRARLEERFVEPNARLARLLGRDLGWSSPTSEGLPANRLPSLR